MEGATKKGAAILAKSRTMAVVGLSSEPDRASRRVTAYLQRHGDCIILVNPQEWAESWAIRWSPIWRPFPARST